MSILTGPAIREAMARGHITITPCDSEQIAQASVDLHLHPRVLFKESADYVDVRQMSAGAAFREQLEPWDGVFSLAPRMVYLASTIERIHAPHHVAVIDGYIEPGFCGQITLEIVAHEAVKIPPGWPIAQVRFHEVVGRVEPYGERGSYTGAAEIDGPQPSRSYRHRTRHA